MSGHVFANGMEVSSKASGNKSIAAMPDVCMSPPSPPAGPIPIPYPNTAMTSDTTDGSKSVQIKGKEIHLKNKSYYKKSNGNQPATNNFGANIITHKITGALKFAAWSLNVKVEGQNVVRFMDLTTHNHANPGGGAMTSSVAMQKASGATNDEDVCKNLKEANKATRKEKKKGPGKLTKKNVVAHAVFSTPNGSKKVMRAASRSSVGKYDNSFCPGLLTSGLGKEGRIERLKKQRALSPKKDKIISRACGKGHPYPSKPSDNRHPCSHAESRIIETIFGMYPQGGGRLVLSIDWPKPRGEKNPWDPCDSCEDLLCVARKCMKIAICTPDGENPTRSPDCPPE